ncbi:hypothetical protein ACIGXM_10125 [Kitasatospora sp. NPDC052896]|uniref:hypothetical protein n=1 Tax=Kitasatospora sp. NPDC052896 TaxID=3364061 RepID=UPI0037CB7D59
MTLTLLLLIAPLLLAAALSTGLGPGPTGVDSPVRRRHGRPTGRHAAPRGRG